MLRRSAPHFVAAAISTIRQRGDPALSKVCPPLSSDILRVPDEPCIAQHPLCVPAPANASSERGPCRLVSFDAMVADLHAALDQFIAENGFGRGIAAPQLGYAARVIALRLNGERHTLVNPVWTKKSRETFTMWDDCFSFPGTLVRTRRHKSGTVRFTTPSLDTSEWMHVDQATCELLQHEIDHLDGVLSFKRAEAAALSRAETPQLWKRREQLSLTADGGVSEVPREIFEACREDCVALVDYFPTAATSTSAGPTVCTPEPAARVVDRS